MRTRGRTVERSASEASPLKRTRGQYVAHAPTRRDRDVSGSRGEHRDRRVAPGSLDPCDLIAISPRASTGGSGVRPWPSGPHTSAAALERLPSRCLRQRRWMIHRGVADRRRSELLLTRSALAALTPPAWPCCAARSYQCRARRTSRRTPSPRSQEYPRPYCASARPARAAERQYTTAALWSCAIPMPQ